MATAHHQSGGLSSQIVPTLLDIERRKYKLGTDDHYKYAYLGQRLIMGTDRSSLHRKKLSQMYSVFDKKHGKIEALALMIFLFKLCDDSDSAEKLEALVDRAPLFTGRNVTEEEREKFNFRTLVVRIVDELDESQRNDFVTILQDQIEEDGDLQSTDYRKILDLMTKACHKGILRVEDPRPNLLEWLKQLGFENGGVLSAMKGHFDSRKQFPGYGPDYIEY